MLGFAYKKDTGDTRESASISLVNSLVAEKADIRIYDPKVEDDQIWMELKWAASDFTEVKKRVTICTSAQEACQDAHAAIIATEWDEFSNKDADVNIRDVNGLAVMGRSPSSYQTGSGMQFSNGAVEIPKINSDAQKPAEMSSSKLNGHVRNPSLNTNPTSPDVITPTGSKQHSKDRPRMSWAETAKIMRKPMFVFDGRNVVDGAKLEKLGFRVESIGKPSSMLRGAD